MQVQGRGEYLCKNWLPLFCWKRKSWYLHNSGLCIVRPLFSYLSLSHHTGLSFLLVHNSAKSLYGKTELEMNLSIWIPGPGENIHPWLGYSPTRIREVCEIDTCFEVSEIKISPFCGKICQLATLLLLLLHNLTACCSQSIDDNIMRSLVYTYLSVLIEGSIRAYIVGINTC